MYGRLPGGSIIGPSPVMVSRWPYRGAVRVEALADVEKRERLLKIVHYALVDARSRVADRSAVGESTTAKDLLPDGQADAWLTLEHHQRQVARVGLCGAGSIARPPGAPALAVT